MAITKILLTQLNGKGSRWKCELNSDPALIAEGEAGPEEALYECIRQHAEATSVELRSIINDLPDH